MGFVENSQLNFLKLLHDEAKKQTEQQKQILSELRKMNERLGDRE